MLKKALFLVVLLVLFLVSITSAEQHPGFPSGDGGPSLPPPNPPPGPLPTSGASYVEVLSLPDTYTSDYVEVSAGKSISMEPSSGPVMSLDIGVEVDAADVELKLEVYDYEQVIHRVPSHPTGNMYKLIDITHENLADEIISDVTIKFKVEREWLSENEVSEDEIVLSRLDALDDSWEELPTRISGWDEGNFRYTSVSPGLSSFAIGKKIVLPQVILVANSIDRALSPLETELSDEFDVVFITPEDFDEYKTSELIIFLGGPDTTGGVGPIVDKLLNEKEKAYLRGERWNNGIYSRKDSWVEGQTVLIAAGNTREDTKFAQVDNIDAIKWMFLN